MWALVKSPLILGNDITNMVRNSLLITEKSAEGRGLVERDKGNHYQRRDYRCKPGFGWFSCQPYMETDPPRGR